MRTGVNDAPSWIPPANRGAALSQSNRPPSIVRSSPLSHRGRPRSPSSYTRQAVETMPRVLIRKAGKYRHEQDGEVERTDLAHQPDIECWANTRVHDTCALPGQGVLDRFADGQADIESPDESQEQDGGQVHGRLLSPVRNRRVSASHRSPSIVAPASGTGGRSDHRPDHISSGRGRHARRPAPMRSKTPAPEGCCLRRTHESVWIDPDQCQGGWVCIERRRRATCFTKGPAC